MKKDEAVTLKSTEQKSISQSNATDNNIKKHKKKGSTFNQINSVITSAVGKTKPMTGRGLADEGSQVSYDEER